LGEEWEVYMPSMPNSFNARYEEWSIWFERFLEFIEEEVVLIGWSLGGMFLAKYLAEHRLALKIKAVFLLAAPGGDFRDVSGTGEDCADFLPPLDLSLFEKQAQNIEIWHSEDDFVVPVTEATWYGNNLSEAKIRIFKDKNHFLVPELPELIESIRRLT
jgi:predicted alpha/beta hydrolase family esterase